MVNGLACKEGGSEGGYLWCEIHTVDGETARNAGFWGRNCVISHKNCPSALEHGVE